MVLVEDQSLKGPLPVDEVLKIAGQIGWPWKRRMIRRIVHRDLKPANSKLFAEAN